MVNSSILSSVKAFLKKPLILAISLILVLLGSLSSCTFSPSKTSIGTWAHRELPALPIPLIHNYSGIINNTLIVAGGLIQNDSNELWSDAIFALDPTQEAWTRIGTLPLPSGGGASVSIPDGLILLGGNSARGPLSQVIQLNFEDGDQSLSFSFLPELPAPAATLTADLSGRKIFILHPSTLENDRAESWSINVSAPPEKRRWSALGAPPFSVGTQLASTVATGGNGKPYIYYFGGKQKENCLRAAFRLDPDAVLPETKWMEIAPLPAGLAGSNALPAGQSHILLIGGTQEGSPPPVFRESWAYHTITDTWVNLGTTSQPTASCRASAWREGYVFPGGTRDDQRFSNSVDLLIYEKPKVNFGVINYLVLGLYLFGLIWMGYYFSKREQGTEDFFLAGKRIPWWAAGLSIYATQLSAITYISVPAVAFGSNLVIYLAAFGIFILAPIVVYFYLPFFRRLNLTTAYEYLEKRFHLSIRLFGSASFMIFQLARMAIVTYLPALALATSTGMNVYLCIVIMSVLAVIYTVLGGMEAVIWTDVLQIIVLMGGTLITAGLILSSTGGLSNFFEIANADQKLAVFDWTPSWTEVVSWAVLIGAFFTNFGPYTTDQAVIQRYLTTKDEKSAARGIWLNGIISVPSLMLFLLVGTALYVFYKMYPENLSVGLQNDEIFPLFISTQLPPGLSGLLIAGIFAASMSSLDSSMHSISTAFITDFYHRFRPKTNDRQRLRIARWIIIILGSVAMCFTFALVRFDIKSLFFFFQKVIGLLSSGLVGIFFLGMFTTRTNTFGAWAGAIISTAVLAYVSFFTNLNFYWYAAIGIPCCLFSGLFFSYLGRSPTTTDLQGLTLFTQKKV